MLEMWENTTMKDYNRYGNVDESNGEYEGEYVYDDRDGVEF